MKTRCRGLAKPERVDRLIKRGFTVEPFTNWKGETFYRFFKETDNVSRTDELVQVPPPVQHVPVG